jgi:hypothetical protein
VKQRTDVSLLFVALLIFNSGCTTSTLSLVNNKRLHLQYDDFHLKAHGNVVAHHQINLGVVYVRQDVFELSEGGMVVFEHAKVQPGYRYNYALKHSIDIIFNAATVTAVETFSNIGFFRVTLRNGNTLNIIAENGNKKYIRLVYGLGDEAFDALIKQFGKGEERDLQFPSPAGTFTEPEKAIQTLWSPKMILLDSLVAKTGGHGMGRANKSGGFGR